MTGRLMADPSSASEPDWTGPAPRNGAGIAALIAVALGLGHAAMTGIWLSGSTLLLDTIGGEIEAWARERSTSAMLVLSLVVIVKLVVGVSAPLYARVGERWLPASWYRWAERRLARILGWIAAAVLTVYGGVLTAVGLLVQADVVDAAADADERALAWHAYLWDPWFLLWGLSLGAALHWSRQPMR